MDIDMLEMATRINGVNNLVINKMDILDEVGTWRVIKGLSLFEFDSASDLEYWLEQEINDMGVDQLFFSRSPEYI